MIFSKIYSAQVVLLQAKQIDIEVDISRGIHRFSIIGLTDKAIEESKERVSSAIKYSGFKPPKKKNQKIVVSLAPAHIKKSGPLFDLPIALAYLQACLEIKFNITDKLFVGELSLDGQVKRVDGILAITKFAKDNGFKEIFIPDENKTEASLITGINIIPVKTLTQVIEHLENKITIKPYTESELDKNRNRKIKPTIDLAEIKGQELAKRALEIAASGGHNLGLHGPPGTGKTMLARAFSDLLPDLEIDKIIETTNIYSVSRKLNNQIIIRPPFRSPHHTASHISIVGGGSPIKPGEITLSHNGTLFMDEFLEFESKVIDSLRQPLEDKYISITRSSGCAEFPADFIFIAATNPCPCGFFQTEVKECKCSIYAIEKYRKKISGPIADRIDLWTQVGHIDNQTLFDNETKRKPETHKYRKRIVETRKIQAERFLNKNKLNVHINNKELNVFCKLDPETNKIFQEAVKKLNISIRSYTKILKISRTIADMEKSKDIKKEHLLEALIYRPKNLF